MMMTFIRRGRSTLLLVLFLFAVPFSTAHHSDAGFDPDERFQFEGTITDIFWGNPHILITVDDGETAMRVEWVTTAGADKTQVPSERLRIGDRLVVIGSRHRDPEVAVMMIIKELRLPAHEWVWISPSVKGLRR